MLASNANAVLPDFFAGGDKDPNPYACNTYGTLGVSTVVQISNYFLEYVVTTRNYAATCGGQSATATVAVPTFANYAVSSAAIGGTNALTLAVSNDGKTAESTRAAFLTVASGALVDVVFSLTAAVPATITSCTTDARGNEINTIVWNRPWLTP